MDKSQGRVCRYCGRNNLNKKTQTCAGCGGSLAPLEPPSRLVTAASELPAQHGFPTYMVAAACIAAVGIAMVIPLPKHHAGHPVKHSAPVHAKALRTVSFASDGPAVAQAAASEMRDACERAKSASDEAIQEYKNAQYFNGFVHADSAVKLAQNSCPSTLKPVRLGYALSARALNGRHLRAVDPRMDFEEASAFLGHCGASPLIYGAAASSACANMRRQDLDEMQALGPKRDSSALADAGA